MSMTSARWSLASVGIEIETEETEDEMAQKYIAMYIHGKQKGHPKWLLHDLQYLLVAEEKGWSYPRNGSKEMVKYSHQEVFVDADINGKAAILSITDTQGETLVEPMRLDRCATHFDGRYGLMTLEGLVRTAVSGLRTLVLECPDLDYEEDLEEEERPSQYWCTLHVSDLGAGERQASSTHAWPIGCRTAPPSEELGPAPPSVASDTKSSTEDKAEVKDGDADSKLFRLEDTWDDQKRGFWRFKGRSFSFAMERCQIETIDADAEHLYILTVRRIRCDKLLTARSRISLSCLSSVVGVALPSVHT